MADISFSESMLILIEAMTNSMKEIIHATDEQLVRVLEVFLNKFPNLMKASFTAYSSMLDYILIYCIWLCCVSFRAFLGGKFEFLF